MAPWKLAKAERSGDAEAGARLDAVMFELVCAVQFLGTFVRPVLPLAAERILSVIQAQDGAAPGATWGSGIAGAQVSKPPALFPRKEEPAS